MLLTCFVFFPLSINMHCVVIRMSYEKKNFKHIQMSYIRDVLLISHRALITWADIFRKYLNPFQNKSKQFSTTWPDCVYTCGCVYTGGDGVGIGTEGLIAYSTSTNGPTETHSRCLENKSFPFKSLVLAFLNCFRWFSFDNGRMAYEDGRIWKWMVHYSF